MSWLRPVTLPFVLLVAGCAPSSGVLPTESPAEVSTAQPPAVPSTSPASSAPPRDAEAKPRTPAPPTEGAAGAESPAPAEPPEIRRETHYPEAAAVVVGEWLTAHHATGGVVEKQCWDLVAVGVPGAPGLLCVRSTSRPSREQARIYRLEDGRLRAVWEGPIGTWMNWLELTPLLSADGATLMVQERRAFSCEAARDEYTAKEAAGVPMDWGGVLREGCSLRGRYVYDGKRYVKDRGAGGG